MQRPLLKGTLFALLTAVLGLYWQNSGLERRQNPVQKTWHFSSQSPQPMRPNKLSTPFHANPIFQWIDESRGVGRAQVEIEGESFVGSTWSYQWILPAGVTSRESLQGDFEAPQSGSGLMLELEVEGLDFTINQNIILRAGTRDSTERAMAVVVPSRFDLTLEGQVSEEPPTALSPKGLRSNKIDSPRALPKGIQF
jgi:hypothetical protein